MTPLCSRSGNMNHPEFLFLILTTSNRTRRTDYFFFFLLSSGFITTSPLIGSHEIKRMIQWLCKKGKVEKGKERRVNWRNTMVEEQMLRNIRLINFLSTVLLQCKPSIVLKNYRKDWCTIQRRFMNGLLKMCLLEGEEFSQEAEFCLSQFLLYVWHLIKSQPSIAWPSVFSVLIVKQYEGRFC